MNNYTMWTDQIGDSNEDDFCPRFTFEAKNQKDADKKASSWARYHSLPLCEVVAKITEGEQLKWATRNEYVL